MVALRRHLLGWALHTIGLLKKMKSHDCYLLSMTTRHWQKFSEIERKSQSNADIARLLREEELKWYQGSEAQFILEGDSNTR
jgi:hypothetical protein